MAEERYPYGSQVWLICLMIAGVLVAVTAMFAVLPSENGAGSVDAVVPVMFVLIVPLLAFAGFAYSREAREGRAVVLSQDTISAPPNALSARSVIVPYTQISDVSVVRLKATSTLRVTHSGGVIGIPGAALASPEAVEILAATLHARVKKAMADA